MAGTVQSIGRRCQGGRPFRLPSCARNGTGRRPVLRTSPDCASHSSWGWHSWSPVASGGPASTPPISPGSSASPRDVNIIAKDYSFLPPEVDLVPGETVLLHVINGGLDVHEVVIGDPAVQDAWEAAEAAAANPPPGPTPLVTVPAGTAGVRIVVQSGQRVDLLWTVPADPGAAPDRLPHPGPLGEGDAGLDSLCRAEWRRRPGLALDAAVAGAECYPEARLEPTQPGVENGMTYVIAEPCVDVIDQSCVSVCPVDCIHFEEGIDRKLFIDPNECIDCGACEPECPVNAIFPEESLPAEWANYTTIDATWFTNREAARVAQDAAKPR